MPAEKTRKGRESLERKLKAIIVRIPINTTTVTAALLLVTQVIALAQVLKVPLEVEKVAPLEGGNMTSPQIPMAEDQK